jgi:hypothetical protein
MINEVPDRTYVIRRFLEESQGLAHRPRDLLASGIVKALDVMGVARFLRDRFVPLWWDHPCVGVVLIRMARRQLWAMRPKFST